MTTDSYSNVHIIINPASGKDQPILNVVNDVLGQDSIPWKAHVTYAAGDATTLTRQAIEDGADLIISYGGDGTLMEVINGMIDSNVPLGILPGGTGNSVASELGMPNTLEDALEVVLTSRTFRRLDLGRIGERHFVLRVFTGIDEEQIASREMKDKYGLLAYPIAAIQFLRDAQEAHYHVSVDGETVSQNATLCYVDNIGCVGGVRPYDLLQPIGAEMVEGTGQETRLTDVDPWDGMLDLILIGAESNELLSAVGFLLNIGDARKHVTYLRGKQIRIEATPPQPVSIDGENYGETPVEIEVAPAAVKVVLPSDSDHAL